MSFGGGAFFSFFRERGGLKNQYPFLSCLAVPCLFALFFLSALFGCRLLCSLLITYGLASGSRARRVGSTARSIIHKYTLTLPSTFPLQIGIYLKCGDSFHTRAT